MITETSVDRGRFLRSTRQRRAANSWTEGMRGKKRSRSPQNVSDDNASGHVPSGASSQSVGELAGRRQKVARTCPEPDAEPVAGPSRIVPASPVVLPPLSSVLADDHSVIPDTSTVLPPILTVSQSASEPRVRNSVSDDDSVLVIDLTGPSGDASEQPAFSSFAQRSPSAVHVGTWTRTDRASPISISSGSPAVHRATSPEYNRMSSRSPAYQPPEYVISSGSTAYQPRSPLSSGSPAYQPYSVRSSPENTTSLGPDSLPVRSYPSGRDAPSDVNRTQTTSSNVLGVPVVMSCANASDDQSTSQPMIVDLTDDTSDDVRLRPEIIVLDDDDAPQASSSASASTAAKLLLSPPKPLAANGSRVDQLKCAICLDSPQQIMATVCGHLFCRECIITAIRAQRMCALCRSPLTRRSIRRVEFKLKVLY